MHKGLRTICVGLAVMFSMCTMTLPTFAAELPAIPTTVTATQQTVLAKGIDVSAWQGDINWEEVKNSGIDYAMIRAGYGMSITQKDKKFEANIQGAKAVGLDTGVYWYSYATTLWEARQEAKVCMEAIKGYNLEYPVAFDIEDAIYKGMSKKEVTAIIDAFCSELEKSGYYVVICSYSDFLNRYVDESIYKDYDVWVAHYRVAKPSFAYNYGQWQYSCTEKVQGVLTDVDMNYAYKDYPATMKNFHLNGY